MLRARCSDCGKNWRVPDADRARACRDCGGRVVCDETAPPCASCGRESRPGDLFCHFCGLALHDDVEAPTRGEREAAVERRLAGIELGKGRKAIRSLRIYMGILAGLATMVAVIGTLDPATDDFTAIGAAGLAVLFTLGAIRVVREPLLWTVTLASIATVFFIAQFQELSLPRFGRNAIGLVLIWAAVPRASRLQQILRDHPDLGFDRPAATGESAVLRRRFERREVARRREMVLLGGLVLAVAALAFGLGSLVLAPPSLAAPRAALEAAWNDGDGAALSSLFDPEFSRRGPAALERQLARRGWTDRRPPLPAEAREDIAKGRARLFYRLDDGELEVVYRLDEKRGWLLVGFDFPDYTPPTAIYPRLDEFERAWNAADLAALGAFWINEEKHELMARRFEKNLSERAWLPRPPRILGRRIDAETAIRKEVVVTTEGGELRLKWEYRHPRWMMRGLAFPR